MSKKLEGKVAIVTGASKGIGASIALHLAAEGASVVVNYSSSKEGADRVVGEINGNGGRAIAVQGNVAKEGDVRRLFAETKRAFGRLDVLVNNAGVYEFKPLEQVTADHFHRMYDVNVLGLVLATQEAVKLFGDRGGSVINISSVAATAAPPTGSLYSGTKAAVDAEFFPASRAIERSATEVMPEGRIKSNFLCNLGYGEAKGLHPRLPRLNFEEVCKVI